MQNRFDMRLVWLLLINLYRYIQNQPIRKIVIMLTYSSNATFKVLDFN